MKRMRIENKPYPKLKVPAKRIEELGRLKAKQVRLSNEQHARLIALKERTGRSLTELVDLAIANIE